MCGKGSRVSRQREVVEVVVEDQDGAGPEHAGEEQEGAVALSAREDGDGVEATLAQLPQAAGGLQPGGIQNGTSPDRPVYVFDVRPREGFGFAPESFFFRNRGAGTSRAVAGNPLPVAQPAPVSPRVAPGTGRRAAG